MRPDGALALLQTLIQEPSLPGDEGAVARLIHDELIALGFDGVHVDEVGNVIGRVAGRGEAPALLFNTHLDHVDPGDHDGWPDYGQPYSGTIRDGRIWGRGATDIKGPLVAQLYGLAALVDDPPPGDVYFGATVQEEVGGLGAHYLCQRFDTITPLVVVGEPSGSGLRRGHRGRTELVVHLEGRAVHASVPERGINPHYILARFLQALPTLEMARDEELGPSSVAPTLIRSDQTSSNVTPGELWLTLDWRNIPAESSRDARRQVQALLDPLLPEGALGHVSVGVRTLTSYTGVSERMEVGMPPFILPASHPAVQAAEAIIGAWRGEPVRAGLWQFATDGGHFARAGMTVIGFGPGDEHIIHTNREHIEIDGWRASIAANTRLAREWPSRVAATGG